MRMPGQHASLTLPRGLAYKAAQALLLFCCALCSRNWHATEWCCIECGIGIQLTSIQNRFSMLYFLSNLSPEH